MRIRLYAVGRTREGFIEEGIKKYLKLVKPYADLKIEVVKDERGRSPEETAERESERILKAVPDYILLDAKGRETDSEGFAEFLRKRDEKGVETAFVIGGAFGVSDGVRKRAREVMSLSRMTLTHEMARLVFCEQIFRGLCIINKRSYHH